MKILIKKFALIICLTMSGYIHSQAIDSITYIPKNPSPGDTISLFCYVAYPNIGCPLTSKSWYFGTNYTVYLKAFHCGGNLSMLCYTTDTFKVVIPVGYPSNYTFTYMPGFKNQSPCVFPVDTNGDTLPYPYSTKSISINVSVAGINKYLSNNFFFDFYPNPTNSANINMVFQAPTNTQAQVIVYDMMGRAVYSNNLNNRNEINNTYSLDVSNLSQGMYIVNLIIDNVKVCKKLVRQ
jgi:hypothetical protein